MLLIIIEVPSMPNRSLLLATHFLQQANLARPDFYRNPEIARSSNNCWYKKAISTYIKSANRGDYLVHERLDL